MNRYIRIVTFHLSLLIIFTSIQGIIYPQELKVEKFILLNVDQNRRIPEFDPLVDGALIDLFLLQTKNLNIFARISPDTVGSVVFSFDGNPFFNIENTYPYTLAGDDNNLYKSINFSAGWHKLTCTPFSGPQGQGLMGAPLTINFRVIDSSREFPFVDAGANELISFPQNKLSLKGLTADDGFPDPPGKVSTFWEVLIAPGAVNIARPDSISTDAEFIVPGTYFLLLSATDGSNTSQDTVIIVVRPEPQISGSLKDVEIPSPYNVPGFDFSQYVVDKSAAIKLGKMLFWDMQAGSDGVQACASCHFHAGADSRIKNQMNPGLEGIANKKFFGTRGPNYQLSENDFPFIKEDDDIVSSQGVFNTSFVDIIPGSMEDSGIPIVDSVFSIFDIKTRRVQPRNTPSAINAVYNYRNNWNGNAQPAFNGVSPEGLHDVNAKLLQVNGEDIISISAAIPYSSLASQAVGPIISPIEMSFHGRIFPKVGKKILNLLPLAKQLIDPTDSQLGVFSNYPLKGLKPEITYDSLIKKAFNKKWWNSDKIIIYSGNNPEIMPGKSEPLSSDEFTLMEANFSLFWGLSLQLYQATLISDDTKFDQFREGKLALSDQEMRGLNLFMDKGRCINCHSGPEFSNASVTNQKTGKLIDRMLTRDSTVALYDIGFYDIGVRHHAEDPGAEAKDRMTVFLSYSKQYTSGTITDTISYDHNNFTIPGQIKLGEKTAVRGTFKVPGLRNVELTGPYFHNGGKATLKQVIEAYNVGNHFAGENQFFMSLDIRPLGLTEDEQEDLIAFLKTLTDERVRKQSAPFDHPQIILPHGHPGNQFSVTNDGTGKATEQFIEIPAVGAAGGIPIKPFLENIFNVITNINNGVDQKKLENFVLNQNYPNPFNPITKIKYSLPFEGNVKLTIFNSLGQTVQIVVNSVQTAGNHEIEWNGKNFSSGIYFYRMEVISLLDQQRKVSVKKMVLLR